MSDIDSMKVAEQKKAVRIVYDMVITTPFPAGTPINTWKEIRYKVKMLTPPSGTDGRMTQYLLASLLGTNQRFYHGSFNNRFQYGFGTAAGREGTVTWTVNEDVEVNLIINSTGTNLKAYIKLHEPVTRRMWLYCCTGAGVWDETIRKRRPCGGAFCVFYSTNFSIIL